MTTTRKQLITMAIGLIKEIAKSPSKVHGNSLDYKKDTINLWFYDENTCKGKFLSFYKFDTIRENKKKFALAVRLIKNKNLAHKFISGN